MQDDRISVAKALQAVVDMVAEAESSTDKAARIAMLLQMIGARIGRDAYCSMLRELARFVVFKTKEIELGRISVGSLELCL